MILHIISVVLILAYGYFMWRRGLFESLVMAVCCLFAAGLAVTSYQAVAAAAMLKESQPTFGEPLTLGLMFLVSLFIMRVLADKFIKQEMHLPLYVDKSIAAVLGVFSGIIMAGIPLTMLQMIPLGDRSVMGYTPFDDNLKGYNKISPFAPDDFVLGLGRVFSTASMGSGNPMPTAQEQKLEWFIRRNSAGLGGGTMASQATQDQLATVKKVYKLSAMRIEPVRLKAGVDYSNYAVRCVMNINAADEDRWWRLPATQFPIFTRSKKGVVQRHFPIGYIVRCSEKTTPGWSFKMIPAPDEAAKQPLCTLAVQRGENNASTRDKGLVIDWVYQIPEDETMTELVFRNDKPTIIRKSAVMQDLPMDIKAFMEAEVTLTRESDKGFQPMFPPKPKPAEDEKLKKSLQKLPSPLVKQATKDKLIKINEHEKALEKAIENEANPAPAPAAAPATAPADKPAATSKPADGGFVFKPNCMYMKCLETGEIFELDPSRMGPDMMGGMPGERIKNPKTGKNTCVMMLKCPACGKFFVPKYATATDPNAAMNGGPLVCTECNTDINQWYRDHRKRRR